MMGRHEHSALHDLFLGSAGKYVEQHAGVPVRLVRQSDLDAAGAAGVGG